MTAGTSLIHKLGNKKLIDDFFNLSSTYNNFKAERLDHSWDRFWVKMEYFASDIEAEYWSNFYSLYDKYTWNRESLNINPFIKIYYELIKFSLQAVKFLLVVGGIFILFTIYNEFVLGHFFKYSKIPLPKGSIKFSLFIEVFFIMYWDLL
jgi:hypothetical protein